MRRPRTTPQKSTLCGWVITIFPCSSAYSCHAHMNHSCISTDMSSQEFPCVQLKDMQVKDSTGGYWLWEALPAEALVLLNLPTCVKHSIHKYRSIRVSKLPWIYPAGISHTDDRHLWCAPSELECLLSWGTHHYSAKHLWKQPSTHYQLGHCSGFSPTAWLKAGTVGFLNPWLC